MYGISRNILSPDRREFFAWKSDGGWGSGGLSAVVLRPSSGSDVECLSYGPNLGGEENPLGYDYALRVVVPAYTPAGTYTVRVEGVSTGLTVTFGAARTVREWATVRPHRSWVATVQSALVAGRPVILEGGIYPLSSTLSAPSGSYLRGLPGAIVECSVGARVEFDGSASPGTLVEGIAFRSHDLSPLSSPGLFAGSGSPEPEDIDLYDCEFRNVWVGQARSLVRCRLDDSTWYAADSYRLAYKCTFRGRYPGYGAAIGLVVIPSGCVAVVQNRFELCGRGLVANTNAAAIKGTLVAFNNHIGNAGDGNGNEDGFLVEGSNAFDDNLFLYVTSVGGRGVQYMIFDPPAADNRIVGCKGEGLQAGVYLSPRYAGGITGTQIVNCEYGARNPFLFGHWNYDHTGVAVFDCDATTTGCVQRVIEVPAWYNGFVQTAAATPIGTGSWKKASGTWGSFTP